jgi:hypothetical protein
MLQFALNLDLRYKLKGAASKLLHKQVAMRYLPPGIVKRKKMGFHVPWLDYALTFPRMLRDGFVSDWTRMTAAELESWCGQDPGKLYKLIAVEVWGRIFVHRERWQDVKIRF